MNIKTITLFSLLFTAHCNINTMEVQPSDKIKEFENVMENGNAETFSNLKKYLNDIITINFTLEVTSDHRQYLAAASAYEKTTNKKTAHTFNLCEKQLQKTSKTKSTHNKKKNNRDLKNKLNLCKEQVYKTDEYKKCLAATTEAKVIIENIKKYTKENLEQPLNSLSIESIQRKMHLALINRYETQQYQLLKRLKLHKSLEYPIDGLESKLQLCRMYIGLNRENKKYDEIKQQLLEKQKQFQTNNNLENLTTPTICDSQIVQLPSSNNNNNNNNS